MRHYTEADLAKIPGLEITDRGHYLDSPTGRAFIENAHPMDELCANSIMGLLNVSVALRNVVGGKARTLPIDLGMRRNVARTEYKHSVVKHMTPKRRDEPILMLIACDGVNVIDGTHRLKRRIRDKLPTVDAFILNPETLRQLRVRIFKEIEGKWIQESGLSDEQMEAQIIAAKGVLEKMMRGGK